MLCSSFVLIPRCFIFRTEQVLDHVMRTMFEQCTVITLGQRLSTVVEADRVMVSAIANHNRETDAGARK